MTEHTAADVMEDRTLENPPKRLAAILSDTKALGFNMQSEPKTGSLLRTLAASKARGRVLELGTGTGVGTSWLLSGMDPTSRLDSIESDATVLAVARHHLGDDPRVTFHLVDAADFLSERRGCVGFDLIYADAWPGKFTLLDLTLSLLAPGGVYVVDDLLPQTSWRADHHASVVKLIAELESRPDLVTTKLAWASGLMLASRKG